MKSFSLLKIPMILLGLGAILVFAPSSRAQAEVSPDHYDAIADVSAPAKPKNLTAQRGHSGDLVARLRPAAANNLPGSQQRDVVAVQDKRKAASSNSQPH